MYSSRCHPFLRGVAIPCRNNLAPKSVSNIDFRLLSSLACRSHISISISRSLQFNKTPFIVPSTPSVSYRFPIFLHTMKAYNQKNKSKQVKEHVLWATGDEIIIDTVCWCIGTIVLFVGLSYLTVPLYRIFCETNSFGGIAQTAKDFEKIAKMRAVRDRVIKVKFASDTASTMAWNFKPLQEEIYVYPGETALAFYTAKNPTDKPIIGISSYNIEPFQVAYYFNKIQCFCFEDQLLNPNEEVDLPVFFYIDPDFANDPKLEAMNELSLNYIFYESTAGIRLLTQFEQEQQKQLAKEQQNQQRNSLDVL